MTRSSRPALAALAVATSLLGAASGAGAVPLNNGFSGQNFLDTPLSGTTSAARPELAGLVLADTDTPFSVGGVTGFVQNRVVREFGTGTLDFYWRVELDPSTNGNPGITAFRLADFGYGYLTDADYRIDGTGTVPASTARLFNPGAYPQGDINFLFGTAIEPGQSSEFFFLHTNAVMFKMTADYDFVNGNNDIGGGGPTYAPAVPEPAPAALLALGVLTLAGLRSRRAGKA
ncbi:MAG TPA: hypothetical protein VIP05_21685 [Burkholderiaceae bacterium]